MTRLDVYLAETGKAKSRSFASECIKKGLVTVNGKITDKPSFAVEDTDRVEITALPYEYVGRGGLKLEAALDAFGIDVGDKTAVDIGASTGGFTDCLLRRGAVKVAAVDSGHGQLDEALREDERVINIEGYNARYLKAEDIGFSPDIAVCDVSFISQTIIIPAAASVLKDGGMFVSLIKPQFECGKSALGKNGVVKDKWYHAEAIAKVCKSGEENGLNVSGIIKSPIEGGDGNTEFLVCFKKSADYKKTDLTKLIKEVTG